MAFSTTQRVAIRRFLGGTALYQQYDSRLESAIDAIGSDATQQTEAEALLTQLDAIDAALIATWPAMIAARADDVQVDAARGAIMLRSEGRRYAGRLARIFGFERPLADAFAATSSGDSASPSGL